MTRSGIPLSRELTLTAAHQTEPLNGRSARFDGRQQLGGMGAGWMASTSDESRSAPEASEPSSSRSVFASLMSGVATQRPAGTDGGPITADRLSAPKTDVPLSEIGFGPGMLLRLSQLGLRSTADLARSNAERLRADLGESSRFVDVEAWIRRANECTLRP